MKIPRRLQPLAADGPVIIDLPQAVDAAGNNGAEWMFERDVDNMRRYFGRFAPELLATDYGKEIWALYEAGELHPESVLTGRFVHDTTPVDVDELMTVIDDVRDEEARRRAALERSDEPGVEEAAEAWQESQKGR